LVTRSVKSDLESPTDRQLAGPELLFYQEYFYLPGGVAEREAEMDLRRWLISVLYSNSADQPLPEALTGVDLTTLSEEMISELLRTVMCLPRSGGLLSRLKLPDKLPSWLSEDDLEFYLADLEHSGLTGGLNYPAAGQGVPLG
jgi:hypothetical protein